jgi:hypothetical protein
MKAINLAWLIRFLAAIALGLIVNGFSARAAEPNTNAVNGKPAKFTAIKEADRQAEVVFDNTVSNITLMTWRGLEMGSRITLSGEVNFRYFLRFKFQYFLSDNATGKERVQLRFYMNDGTNRSPGKLPFFSLTEIPLIKGTNSYVVEAVPFAMPDSFTWTVQFYNIKDAEVGLLFNGPPSVGFGEDMIWEKVKGQWIATTAPQSKSGFSAQIVATKAMIEAFVPLGAFRATEASIKPIYPQPVSYQSP